MNRKADGPQTRFKGLLGDPALAAMGLVPAHDNDNAHPFENNPVLPSWRAAWMALGLCVVAMLGLFWTTAVRIVTTWSESSTFNHGFLILPICGYLIWLKRGALSNRAPQPSLWGAVVILVAGLGWLTGHVGSVVVVEEFALTVMIQGVFLTILGPKICRLLLIPLAYLLFAVPFGSVLVPPLQDLTAEFVVVGLRLVGVPVFHNGIFISTPTGNFLVAEACSGVRFLIATVALGCLFAHLTYTSHWRKAAFLVLTFAVPVVANGIRAFGIVLLAYLSDNAVAVRTDHVLYGWIFFSIVTVILLAIGMTFRDNQPVDERPDANRMRGAALQAVSPPRIVLAAIAALCAGVVSPVYAGMLDSRAIPAIHGPLQPVKPKGGWRLGGVTRDSWSPSYPDAHASLLRTYVKNGREVQMFVAIYATERQGYELISHRNKVVDGQRWSRAASGEFEAVVSGTALAIDRVRMLAPNRQRLAYRWYWINGHLTANPYVAKFLQTKNILLGAGEASAVIVISSEYDERPQSADAVLQDFAASLPPVASWLGRYAYGD